MIEGDCGAKLLGSWSSGSLTEEKQKTRPSTRYDPLNYIFVTHSDTPRSVLYSYPRQLLSQSSLHINLNNQDAYITGETIPSELS